MTELKELDEDSGGGDFSDNSDTKIAVRAAPEKPDGEHREVLVMRYIAGLTANETAEQLGISRFAVYRLEKGALVFAAAHKHP